MAIHDGSDDREKTPLEEIIARCSTSRDRRRNAYRMLRTWFQLGTILSAQPALFNRLESHVEKLSSMLYAPESAKFMISVSPKYRKEFMAQLEVARDEFQQVWRNTGSDVQFASDVEWANVYGTIIEKIIPGPRGTVRHAPIDPSAFGVMREDIMSLDRQPAFVHWYVTSLQELQHKVQELPNAAEIMSYASARAMPNNSPGVEAGAPGGMMSNVIVTSINNPDSVSGIIDLGAVNAERPDVTEPTVELAEVWRWVEITKDMPGSKNKVKFFDYIATTCLDHYKLWESRNPVLPWLRDDIEAENPFVVLRPKPTMDYFWGKSGIASLTMLQDVADGHLADIRDMMGRQLDPSALISGWNSGSGGLDALRKRGGFASSPIPGAKLQPLVPTMPPQAFELLTAFNQMFDEAGGIPEDLGTGQEDIRVQGQIQGTARKMGRIRKKALIVEDSLELLTTRMFHVLQRNDATEYTTDSGETFRLADLPASAVVKVSAHSASPVYAEQTIEKAMIAMKAGAIDAVDLIELLDLPMTERLKEKAKVLMQGQAEAAKEERRIEELKVTRPARR